MARDDLGKRGSDLAPAGADVLTLVVAQKRSGARVRTEEVEHLRRIGAAVDDVADGDDLVLLVQRGLVEEFHQFGVAAVYVADDEMLHGPHYIWTKRVEHGYRG